MDGRERSIKAPVRDKRSCAMQGHKTLRQILEGSGSGKRSGDGERELRYMNVTWTTKAGDDGCGVDTLRNPKPRSVS